MPSALDAPPLACAATTRSSAIHSCGPRECPGCISFLLLHKCASTTILHVLNAPIWRTSQVTLPNRATRCGGVYYCDWMAHAATGCRAHSLQPHELADRRDAWLYFGGYLPTMAPDIAVRGCRRFALLREPVARLLSARLYCARNGKGRPATEGGDVLCGNRSTGSVTEWASHWGAYLFRQLALEPGVYRTLAFGRALPTPAAPGCTFPEECARGVATFSWTDQKAAFGQHDDGTSTRAGRAAVQLLSRRLGAGRLFDVVAIYEEWNASMALLDATLPLPAGRRWLDQSVAHKQNARRLPGQQQRAAEQAQLDAARLDPNVTRLIAADRRLYVAGLNWFYALCRRHRIQPLHADRRALANSLDLSDAVLHPWHLGLFDGAPHAVLQ